MNNANEARELVWPRITEFSFTSKTAEEAVARTLEGDRAARAARDTPALAGRTLEDATWGDSELHLHLDDGSDLRIFVDDGGRVDWERSRAQGSRPAGMRIGSPPIDLALPGSRENWDASGMLGRRIGRPLRSIVPGKVWLRVYIGDLSPLWLWVFRDRGTRNWFLYWTDRDSD